MTGTTTPHDPVRPTTPTEARTEDWGPLEEATGPEMTTSGI